MADSQESKADVGRSIRKLSETPARTQMLKKLLLFRGHSPDEKVRDGCCFQRSADLFPPLHEMSELVFPDRTCLC